MQYGNRGCDKYQRKTLKENALKAKGTSREANTIVLGGQLSALQVIHGGFLPLGRD
jgi:hypothetical protein